MSRRIPLRALGAWLLALAFVVSFTLPASATPASEVGGSLTIDSLVTGVDSLASVDGPGHHFGYSQASVVAQATAITIQKTASPSTVAAGGSVTYTIPITNVSGTAATGVTVTDTLPAGMTLTSVPTTSTGTCTGTVGTTSFTCSLGTLGAGTSATVTAVGLVPTTTTNGTVLTNIANVTGVVGNTTQTGTATAATTVTSTTPVNGSPTAATALPVLQAGGFTSGGFNNGFQNNTCGGIGQQGFQGQQFFQGQTGFAGGTCQVTGAVTGTATVTGSAVWNLTVAAAPAGALAGVAPVAFALTTVAPVAPGEGPFPCTALAVVGGTTTCNFTTTGNPLPGLTAAVCYATAAAPVCVFGTVIGNGANVLPIIPPGIGPGFGPNLPLLPPPPLQFIPPPPPPLLPPPPPAPTGGSLVRPTFPDVPVVPEADTVVLLFGGLAALGIAAGARSLRRRKR